MISKSSVCCSVIAARCCARSPNYRGREAASKPQTVAEPGRDRAERRQLTVMFCDLVGSTELSARLDPEDMGQLVALFHHRIAEVIDGYQGIVARYMGDGVLAYFGYPQAHEDDAEQ